jgi:type IV pilus assembly protein PilE
MPRSDRRAFTLIEMLVVVTIMAVLAAVAYPSYREQIHKMRRGDARQSLVRVAQQLERCYTRYRRYDHGDCPLISAGPTIAVASNDGRYAISSRRNGTESLTANTFTLYATPLGNQASDRQCAEFRFTNTSVHQAFDAAGIEATSTCW